MLDQFHAGHGAERNALFIDRVVDQPGWRDGVAQLDRCLWRTRGVRCIGVMGQPTSRGSSLDTLGVPVHLGREYFMTPKFQMPANDHP